MDQPHCLCPIACALLHVIMILLINKNSAEVDIAPALGKIITKLQSHWSVKCWGKKRCMLVEYVNDNYYARFHHPSYHKNRENHKN